ncbi:hypothetical protein B0T25DRAFT_516395 [Lasiosphaeria hispida]|uniref:Uncharacterized protein n=1 Tax=Lasiosphaeria hispida TaxID=260671 RepID=A0AAJ0HLK9_9PEZI|nr:hypothetical protein B0T25DRAFT_516395 [Lasiosphaeria hispida]
MVKFRLASDRDTLTAFFINVVNASTTMAASPLGFALRLNGSSCLSQEVDCGATVAPYRICCPAGSFCPSQYNVNCCPSADNCTASLIENARCANETWDLYDNGGFFCCLKGLFGYAARATDSNGCGSEGYILKSGEVRLPLIEAGQGIGVGVGGGALALLLVAWIVYRHVKKKSETGKAPDTVHPMVSDTGSKHPQYRQELEGKQIPAELDHRYPVELDGHPR